jgi:hypothetical protein
MKISLILCLGGLSVATELFEVLSINQTEKSLTIALGFGSLEIRGTSLRAEIAEVLTALESGGSISLETPLQEPPHE